MSVETRAGRLLVIEDDRDIRESVVEVLEDEGHTVSSAADGRQALELLASASALPEVILLDLMMPVMNGFQFRQEQLQRPSIAAIPVVIVTADVNAKHQAEALGVAGVVQKPLKIQPLLDLIQRLLPKA